MMKTAPKGQGKTVMEFFVITVVLKAVFYYKDEALQFKKCVWAFRVKAF